MGGTSIIWMSGGDGPRGSGKRSGSHVPAVAKVEREKRKGVDSNETRR